MTIANFATKLQLSAINETNLTKTIGTTENQHWKPMKLNIGERMKFEIIANVSEKCICNCNVAFQKRVMVALTRRTNLSWVAMVTASASRL